MFPPASIITPSNDLFPTTSYLVIVVTRPNGFDKHATLPHWSICWEYNVPKNYFWLTLVPWNNSIHVDRGNIPFYHLFSIYREKYTRRKSSFMELSLCCLDGVFERQYPELLILVSVLILASQCSTASLITLQWTVYFPPTNNPCPVLFFRIFHFSFPRRWAKCCHCNDKF